MKYSTVLFDWDGCLVHTLEVWVEAAKVALVNQGLNFPHQHIVSKILSADSAIADQELKDPKLFWKQTIEEAILNKDKITLHRGVREMLIGLKKHSVKTAIITRAYKYVNEAMMSNFKINHYFDLIITREDVKNQKPHPESVFLAMKKLGSTPEETIIVGDSEHEVKAGRAAGIDTVLYYPPHNEAFYNIDSHHALQATYLIHNFSELTKIVLRN